MKYLKLFESFDDSSTMARFSLFGADTQMAFEFNNETVTDPDKIKVLIDKYNQTVIESDQWVGGPINREFVDFWNKFSAGKKEATQSSWKPTICLLIDTEDYGTLIIGYSPISKRSCKLDWSLMAKPTTNSDRSVIDGIIHFAKEKIDRADLDINQTIDLLRLNVDNRVDWQWKESV